MAKKLIYTMVCSVLMLIVMLNIKSINTAMTCGYFIGVFHMIGLDIIDNW